MEEDKKNENNEEIKKELTEVEKKQLELDEITDRYKRLFAEFENFKKRSSKERDGLYNSLISDIISAFLPALDNLEKAVTLSTEDEKYKQGIELILKQILDVLASFGVKKIETVGTTFDPELHEAVSSIEDDNLGTKEIKEEYRAGYIIGTKVIRHSMVVVAN